VTLPPGKTTAVSWLLVAHAAGQMQLPAVRLAAAKHAATLTTQAGHINVLPF
jgi:hypothetical protein